MRLAEELADGLEKMGLSLAAEIQRGLLAYVSLLGKWNRVYNLTALRDPEKMLTHHLLDALSVLPYLKDTRRLADIGSGGGLPGIPLALSLPDCHVTLVETNQKKSTFLTQARIELKLENLEIVNRRAEEYQPGEPFDVVISRAFSSLVDFVDVARHLVGPEGKMAAMKGVYPQEELAALPGNVQIEEVVSLNVPGLGAERHLVLMRVN